MVKTIKNQKNELIFNPVLLFELQYSNWIRETRISTTTCDIERDTEASTFQQVVQCCSHMTVIPTQFSKYVLYMYSIWASILDTPQTIKILKHFILKMNLK